MLKIIRISNFKSISDEPILLENFNVLIGPNAAGKSNFVDIFRFIFDVVQGRLSSAIGRRLGWENTLTREKNKNEKIKVEIFCNIDEKEKKSTYNFEYNFEAGYSMRRFFINSENFEAQIKENDYKKTEKFERTRIRVRIPTFFLKGKPVSLGVHTQMKDTLFLQGTFFCSSSFVLSNYIKNWRFYELDVNEARCPCYEDSQGFLLGDGDNLASILDRLKTLKTKMARSVRKQILNLMPILIPGFEDWKTEQLYDGSLGFSIKEKGITKPLLPKMVSDGTIRLLSILLALFYQPYQAQLICLDEPERYLHPQVLKPLVGIMRDISKRTQIIVTTHSAELVKWLEPREVLMVDKIGGITHIVRAQDISMINKFLEEFSLDELWLRGYLKGGKIT